MEPSYWYYIISFCVFAVLSGFFSGTETSFFSLSKVELAKFKEQKSKSANRIIKLMSDSRRLLITILIGNTLVNICAATVATAFVMRLAHDFHFSKNLAIFLEVIVVTLIILLFSEIMPKVMAIRNAQNFALQVSFPIELVYILFYPISNGLESITRLFERLFKIKGRRLFFSEEEIKTLIELGEEKGTIHLEEKEMIDSIFEFGDTTAKEIMVPRIDMFCIEMNTPFEELVRMIRKKGHSRVPVYENRIDNIRGIIHVKDLIPFIDSPKSKLNLQELARPAYFIPESKKIDELLQEFQQEKTHMAIVVDEFGGTSGLVTLEDVIEEIVGEIQDEYDLEQPLYREIDDSTFLVDGKISIEELNEILPEPIPHEEEENYETIGGLIFHITRHVPNKNDRVSFYNYDFVIEDVDKQRIKKVKIIKTRDRQEEKEEES